MMDKAFADHFAADWIESWNRHDLARILSHYMTSHDLRHEATLWFFEKGLNPMEVAAITGHKTLQMLKHYPPLRAEDLVGRLG